MNLSCVLVAEFWCLMVIPEPNLLLEKDRGLKISRIALGIPMGGNLKHMDSMTLEHALKSRIPVNR